MNEYDKAYYENLSIIGLTKSEQNVLLLLLDSPNPWPVSFVANELEIPRQTAHSTLRTLLKKGIIVEIKHNGFKHYYSNIKVISKFIDQQCEAFQRAKQGLITLGAKSFEM